LDLLNRDFDARAPQSKRLAVAAAVTVMLAATAWWVARKAARAERDDPPKGKFISVDGIRLHYLERGRGTPLVLLHGNTLRAEDFVASGLVARLAETHRVVAFDRPGYGHSERPRDRLWTADAQAKLMSHALARLGVASPVVVGHAWGTLVAIALAMRDDVDVRKLVLVSGYYFPHARLDAFLAAPPAIPIVGDVLRYTVSALLARLSLRRTVKSMFMPQPVPADFLRTLGTEMLVRPSQIRARAEDAALMLAGAATLQKRYGALDVPVTILAGDCDHLVDQRMQSQRLHYAVIGSELSFVPGAGHMLHHDALEEIVAATT
jgi:pimeloyl-ACP methyl ester carboxylesterase